MKVLLKARVGSKTNHTALPESIQDYFTIFVRSPEDVFNEVPVISREKYETKYEIAEFAKGLLNGDLNCHEILWLDQRYYDFYDRSIERFKSFREDLINKEVLTKWLHEAILLYTKALNIGRFISSPLKRPESFMTYVGPSTQYSAPHGVSFEDCIILGSFDLDAKSFHNRYTTLYLNELCVTKIIDGVYTLWGVNRHSQMSYPTIFAENGEFQVHDGIINPSDPVYHRGTIYYNQEDYNKYLRKLKAFRSFKVINGYACDTMYHAFRILVILSYYLRKKVIPTVYEEGKLLLDIRNGVYGSAEIGLKYLEYTGVISNFLNTNSTEDSIDKEPVLQAVKLIKNSIKNELALRVN